MSLILKNGEEVSAPAAGHRTLILDSSGNPYLLLPDGTTAGVAMGPATLAAATVIGSIAGGTPGAVTMPQLSSLIAAAGVIPWVMVSPDVNLAGTPTVAIPTALTGFYFMPIANPRWRTTAVAGSISTAPTVKAGNNVNNDNIMAAVANTPSTAAFNGGLNAYSSAGANAVNSVLADMSTQINVQVTVAATGTGLTWTAKLYLLGLLIPV